MECSLYFAHSLLNRLSTRPTEINWTEYYSDVVIGERRGLHALLSLFEKTKQDQSDQGS